MRTSRNIDLERRSYFQRQEEAVRDTYDKVKFYINGIHEESLVKLLNDYHDYRIANKRKVRTSLVNGTGICLGKENLWREGLVDLAASIELWCIADYLTNDCFDGKLDQAPNHLSKDSNRYIIASAIVREIAQDALLTVVRRMKPEKEQEFTDLFSQIVKEAYLHQWVDYGEHRLLSSQELNIDNLEQHFDDFFEKRYVKYKTGNFFGQYTRMAAILAGATDQECSALESFGDDLSIGCQIVNDTADLLNRGYDLKNRLLTLPLVYTILQTRRNVYELEREKVVELFINSGAFNRIREETKRIIRKAKQNLEIFSRKRRAYLSNLATLLGWNKQFRYCEEHKR